MPHTEKQIIGAAGEANARQYLEQQGLIFVAANWRCKLGEIDLIMRDEAAQALVFVEVRTRRPTLYGEGSDTVAAQKQRKLINTARYYQQRMHYWDDIRFDVVSVEVTPGQAAHIEHIPHAFDVDQKR